MHGAVFNNSQTTVVSETQSVTTTTGEPSFKISTESTTTAKVVTLPGSKETFSRGLLAAVREFNEDQK